ncbi:MarR family winged helix-turn-helix transcriptional regulator [Streptomyces sp. SP18BB07]|uniref:MarR family winged helix-turn-helix transcriptional regulator n=1 Tax=Streptomyces sp. SP18BB07 TaxID=3002522 RepID=UPI002E7A49F1|nr:MarR family transcriptional regulator [Streptomyces sp. SP18BB07]MEE1759748.1 MarR family transcriptional regulator [Streptomyces sp. SP18BB07]
MITDRVSFTLARMGRVAETELRQALAEKGLKLSHAHVLGLLAERERVSQQALLEELRVDPSVLVTVLNGLEENGLVTRRRDPADRRRHVVEISDLGTELVTQADSAVRAAEAKLFADLDEQDVTVLRRLLGLIRTTGANACEE